MTLLEAAGVAALAAVISLGVVAAGWVLLDRGLEDYYNSHRRRHEMTQNDKRILILALHADIDVEAVPSMEPHPEGRQGVPQAPTYPWDWCDVEVSARYAGVEARVLLKAQTWPDLIAFTRSDVYRDAQVKALTELLGKLDAAADVIGTVGRAATPGKPPAKRAPTSPGKVRA